MSAGGKLNDEYLQRTLDGAKRTVPVAMALLKAVPLPFIAEGVKEVVKDMQENPQVVLAHLRDLYASDFQGQAQDQNFILGQIVTIAGEHGVQFANRDEQLIFVNALATQIALENFRALALQNAQSGEVTPVLPEVGQMMDVVQLAGFLDSKQGGDASAIRSQAASRRGTQQE